MELDNNKNLLSILQDIQTEYGYLPEDNLREAAETLGMPLIDVYGVATFFKSFSLTPRGRHQVKVCLGTACHVRGSSRISKEIERKLAIKPGETSEDGEFSLETVMCLGCCAVGPVVVVDDRYYGKVTTAKLESILGTVRGEVCAF
ncbi:NADH-quinone oxidoreductase subunit NuoE [Chloroflexota bacterium]